VRILERYAQLWDYRGIRLETGVRQPEAQQLYESMGFRRIEPFGPYVGNPTSVCFEKAVPSHAQYKPILPEQSLEEDK
jgi:putative acetyltransferase